MSSNLEVPRLNVAGQVVLGGIASVAVNGVVHPLNTITRLFQTNHLSMIGQLAKGQRVPFIGPLYKGVGAMCLVDFSAFGTSYTINGVFRENLQPWPSILAGVVSAPLAAFGEGLAINRQVHALPYSQSLKMATRAAGFTATILRDVPYPCLMLYIAPSLQKNIERQYKNRLSGNRLPSPLTTLAIQAMAGGIVGGLGGLATAPLDLIKTRVQASRTPLSMCSAIKEIAEGGFRAFFRGGLSRTLYTGLFGMGINIVNQGAPRYFPSILHAKNGE